MEVDRDPPSSLSGLPVVDRRQSWAGFKLFNQDGATPSSLSSLSDQINLIISVEDTGQGIPLEDQARVFNPFMQVRPSITRTHGGTGIGLSISKCLVHLMKGEIGLASLPQVGSTFSFTAVFTNAGEITQQDNDQSNSISPEFHGMRALLVDPNPVRANVSKYHIRRLGIHVDVVPGPSLGTSSSPKSPLINMVFVEEEIWSKKSIRLLNNGSTPKLFILSNSTSSTLPNFPATGGPTPFVVMKPLRASMLAASLQRAMGVRSNHRNGELHTLSLSTLLRGRKILVVDDNLVNLRVAAGALKKYGADVVNAERGREAIALLTPPHSFDACFMDIQMPEMDGFEATRQIREIESNINIGLQGGELSMEAYGNIANWHVPILAMTADVIQATNEECLERQMDGYVSKPFEAEQLYREVSRFFHTAPDENY